MPFGTGRGSFGWDRGFGWGSGYGMGPGSCFGWGRGFGRGLGMGRGRGSGRGRMCRVYPCAPGRTRYPGAMYVPPAPAPTGPYYNPYRW